jgi:pimeloyl-ACP methyl ester carboxylesterase
MFSISFRPVFSRAMLIASSGFLLTSCGGVPVHTTGVTAINRVQLAYAKLGAGATTVVLQSGLGDGKESWSPIASQLASHYTVFAYDRPGYGDSKETEEARDPCAIARELHLSLQQAGVHPPFLLVGHSLGGLYQYVFAKMYPEEVSGVVLLDPTHPKHWETIQAQSAALTATLKTVRLVSFSATQKREFDDQSSCLENIDFNSPLAVPSRVLLRTEFHQIEAGAFEKIVAGLVPDWKKFTGTKELNYVAKSGHYIHREHPQVVLDAIDAVQAEHH